MASTTTAIRHSDAPVYSGADDFAALLDSSLGVNAGFEGSVVSGIVLRIDDVSRQGRNVVVRCNQSTRSIFSELANPALDQPRRM